MTTKKDIPSKTNLPKKTKAPLKTGNSCNKSSFLCTNTSIIWQGVSVVLFALLIGMFFGENSSQTLSEIPEDMQVQLDANNEFIVYNNKTWIPVEGKPVSLIVLNDESCGSACDPSEVVRSLRQGITPAMVVRKVDVSTPEGKTFLEKFDIKGVPSYVFENNIKDFEREGEKFIEKAREVLIEKDGYYLLDGTKTGFKYGKFLSQPEFDLASEPTLGNGPVTVVEFTDFQCPYCKRLHDSNKDLIKTLVKNGSITYVLKDFPLNFHPQAFIMHKAANCVQASDGNEKYFEYVSKIFENQSNWSGKENAADLALGYASEIQASSNGLSECMAGSQEEIDADIKEGSSYGVSGTPALFIGSQVMPGAIDAATFEAAVKAEQSK